MTTPKKDELVEAVCKWLCPIINYCEWEQLKGKVGEHILRQRVSALFAVESQHRVVRLVKAVPKVIYPEPLVRLEDGYYRVKPLPDGKE